MLHVSANQLEHQVHEGKTTGRPCQVAESHRNSYLMTALICGSCVMQLPHQQLFIDLHLHLQSCAVKCCLQAEKQGPCTRCAIQSYRCMSQQHHTQQALPREGRCICLIPIKHAHTFTYTVSFASPSLTSGLLGVGGLPCI